MSIIIQEERSTGSWFGFGVVILVFVILGLALYYLFFVKPEFLDTGLIKSEDSIEEFSQMNFDPQSVTQSEFFKKQKQYIPLTPVLYPGNPRPFGVQ